jgi:hypothetical protein
MKLISLELAIVPLSSQSVHTISALIRNLRAQMIQKRHHHSYCIDVSLVLPFFQSKNQSLALPVT